MMDLNLLNKNIFVLGAGGLSGSAIIHLLLEYTNQIYAYDDNKSIMLRNEVQNYSFIDTHNEFQIENVLDNISIDYCFISPGFPRKSFLAQYFKKRKIPIIGELDLGFYFIKKFANPYIIGITGTDGKSTTTNLVAELFRSQNLEAQECGNYGKPLSEIFWEFKKNNKKIPDILVVECSSYQLEELYFFQPDIAMILNLAEDHLDRYDSLKDYLSAKLNIVRFMNREKSFLLDKNVYDFLIKYDLFKKIENVKYEILNRDMLEKDFINIFDITFYWKDYPIDSSHNRMNLYFAKRALEIFFNNHALKIQRESLLRTLSSYRGLPHRTEKINEKNNIVFIDDSKSTTVQSLMSALDTFKNDIVFLLVGGLDKNLDFRIINDLEIKKNEKLKIYPYGSAAEKIKNQLSLKDAYIGMEDAFKKIIEDLKKLRKHINSQQRIVVLLSPACASFDQYKNYHERGEHFRKLVEIYSHEIED